jgi:phosphotransferase system HPr-like phosphotransfer protein
VDFADASVHEVSAKSANTRRQTMSRIFTGKFTGVLNKCDVERMVIEVLEMALKSNQEVTITIETPDKEETCVHISGDSGAERTVPIHQGRS